MAFLLMLGSLFGVLTPAMQAYAAEPTITGTCHIEVDDLGANTGGSEPYTTFFVTMPTGRRITGSASTTGATSPWPGTTRSPAHGTAPAMTSSWRAGTLPTPERMSARRSAPNFDLYGQGYTQRVGNFTYMPYGYVRIVKESDDPALTDGNAMYSLAGAEFTVTSQDGSVLGTLTTGEDGTTGTLEVPAGQTVTIRETKPPEGFLPAAEQAVAITTQETATVTFTDAPAYDPAGLMVAKYDGERTCNDEGNLPQGAATLEGAEFTIEYYDTLSYDNYTALNESGIAPARAWVVSTDANGFALPR